MSRVPNSFGKRFWLPVAAGAIVALSGLVFRSAGLGVALAMAVVGIATAVGGIVLMGPRRGRP